MASPQGQRGSQSLSGFCRIRVNEVRRACGGLLELDRVYALRVRLQSISATVTDDHIAQGSAEIRDVGLQRGTNPRGRLLTPDPVDERVDRDDRPDFGDQQGEDRALLRAPQTNRDSAANDLDRPENPEVHLSTVSRVGLAG